MAELRLSAVDLRNLLRLAGEKGAVVVRESEVLPGQLVVGKAN